MAKVFPLFLVVLVLASSVLFLAIPTQEQPANATFYDTKNIMSYQAVDGYLYFRDIPRSVDGRSNGLKVVFDVNTSYVPFNHIDIYSFGIGSLGGEAFTLWLRIVDGYIKFYTGSEYPYQYHLVDIPYTYPYKLELYFSSYWDNLRFHIKFNDKTIVNMQSDIPNLNGDFYTVVFYDNEDYSIIPLEDWNSVTSTKFLVTMGLIPYNMSVHLRDWSDFSQTSYDAGYIDGMNKANDAKANLFPSLIGSIFAFFASIASYEVLGISLLNIMIIVGSVLLLLAVLRVFLK